LAFVPPRWGSGEWLKFMEAGFGKCVSAASIPATQDEPSYAIDSV
jgi:hypothetical protein